MRLSPTAAKTRSLAAPLPSTAAIVSSLGLAACSVYGPELLEESAQSSMASSTGGSGSGSDKGPAVTSETSATGSGGTGGNATSSEGGGGASATGTETTGATSSGGDTGSGGSNGGASASGGTNGSGESSGGTVGDACPGDDCCPDDPDKTEPGECGCGEPETDSDGDGAADCIDLCPTDADKSAPGECGCGVLEQDSAEAAGCLPLKEGLSHRYSFSGTGDEAVDSVGDAHGTLVDLTLDDSGQVHLVTGSNAEYVELPSGLLSDLSSATLEAWFTWKGTATWERLFDFGSTQEGTSGEPGTGETYVFFTPRAIGGSALPRAAFTLNGSANEVVCAGSASLSPDVPHHVALSLDTANRTMTLYIDGALQSAKAFQSSLDELNDVNSWLGRSQYSADPGFVGSIDEFRIYHIALETKQVAFSFEAGPNPSFLDE